jgi:hypothetical protein
MNRVLQELRHSNSTLAFVVTIIGFHVLRPVVFMPPFVVCPQRSSSAWLATENLEWDY